MHTFSNKVVEHLSSIVGAEHLSVADSDKHLFQKLAPDVMIWPDRPEQIQSIVKFVNEMDLELFIMHKGRHCIQAPPSPKKKRILLSTERLTNIIVIDYESLIVSVQAGIKLLHLEDALNRENLSLGPLSPSIMNRSIGGVLAEAPKHALIRQKPFHSHSVSLEIITPRGDLYSTHLSPKRATGPDLGQFFVNHRGRLGCISQISFRIEHLSRFNKNIHFSFPSLKDAYHAAIKIIQNRLHPDRLLIDRKNNLEVVMRLSFSTFSNELLLAKTHAALRIIQVFDCLEVKHTNESPIEKKRSPSDLKSFFSNGEIHKVLECSDQKYITRIDAFSFRGAILSFSQAPNGGLKIKGAPKTLYLQNLVDSIDPKRIMVNPSSHS